MAIYNITVTSNNLYEDTSPPLRYISVTIENKRKKEEGRRKNGRKRGRKNGRKRRQKE